MIVVDTNIIIWDALKPDMLSENAKKTIALANREDGIIFCEISLWEIAMLIKKGRIRVDSGYRKFIKLLLESNNHILQGITPEIAELSSTVQLGANKDPADRIIAATSIIKDAKLVTADKDLRQSKNISTIW